MPSIRQPGGRQAGGRQADGRQPSESSVDRIVNCNTEILSMTGELASVARVRNIFAQTEQMTLAGVSAVITRGGDRTVAGITSSILVSGIVASVTRSRIVNCVAESLKIVSSAAQVALSRVVDCGTAQIILTAIQASIVALLPTRTAVRIQAAPTTTRVIAKPDQ